MRKALAYLLIVIYNILALVTIYLFIYFGIINIIIIIFLNIIIFSKFIFLYFIPVYFILSLYTIEYKGYYKVKFLWFSKNQLYLFILKFFKFLNGIIYNYKYLSIFLLLNILWLSLYYKKIYFSIIFLFLFAFYLIYYFYNYLNKFKIYLEKYFLLLNCAIIIGLAYILKMQDFDFTAKDLNNVDDLTNNSFTGYLAEIGWPRWLYKDAFKSKSLYYKMLPYSKKIELVTLNKGLKFYNLFLEDRYLSNFKNYTNCNLNLDYKILKKIIYNNIVTNTSFIKKAKLGSVIDYRDLYIADNLKHSAYSNVLDYAKFYNKNLFNLTLNKGLNILDYDHNNISRKNFLKLVSFEDKDIYAKSALKELGLSTNLFIQINLITSKYFKFINNYMESGLSSKILDRNISLFLNDEEDTNEKTIDAGSTNSTNIEGINIEKKDEEIFYYNDSFLSNNIKNQYSNDFLNFKVKFINFNNFIEHLWDIDSDDWSAQLKKFLNSLTLNGTVSAFDLYLNSNLYNFNMSNNNERFKELSDFDDIECYIKYFNKYYRYFNKDSNVINWLNDLFIVMLDSEKKEYNYWSEFASFRDIEKKDEFNLYKNFKENFVYMYGDKINDLLDASNEDEDDIDIDYINNSTIDDSNSDSVIQNVYIKEYYSKTDILDEIIGIFLEYDDVNDLYHKFFNYNKDFEIFLNSYLSLSLKDSNIKLEGFETAIYLNKCLSKTKFKLENYMEKQLKMVEFDYIEAKNKIKHSLDSLIKLGKYKLSKAQRKVLKSDKEFLFGLWDIFKLNKFIKIITLGDNYESHVYNAIVNKSNVLDESVNPWLHIKSYNYLFFEKYCNYNNTKNYNVFIKANTFKNNFYFKILAEKTSSYKHFLFIGSFYNFVWDNEVVFEQSFLKNCLRYINDLGEKEKLYSSVDELFCEVIRGNLNYYKIYIQNLNILYENIENDLNKFEGLMYKESDHLILRLQNMLRVMYQIRKNKLFDNEQTFLAAVDRGTHEFSFFKDIFINFRKIGESFNEFCYDNFDNYTYFNEANDKRFNKTLFLNYISIIDYLKEGSMDIKYFNEFYLEINELITEFDKAFKKADSLISSFDDKYVVADVEKFCVELIECENVISNRIGFWNIRGKYKTSTYKEADFLKLQVKNTVKHARLNDYALENDRKEIVKSLEGMYSSANIIRNDINKLKRINDSIDFIKQENLNKILLEQQANINNEDEDENEEASLQAMDQVMDEPANDVTHDFNNELKQIVKEVKVENKQKNSISRWKRVMAFKSAAW